MTDSPPPYESYWAFFRDVGITLLLFILSVVIAGFLRQSLSDTIDLPYMIVLPLAMAPLLWFLKHCQIHNYDWWDYGALIACAFAVSGLTWLLEGVDRNLLDYLRLLVGICLFAGWLKLRVRLRPASST